MSDPQRGGGGAIPPAPLAEPPSQDGLPCAGRSTPAGASPARAPLPALHRLVARQVKRHLPELDVGAVPGLLGLLEAVGDAYAHADEDRRMLENALELSSTELLGANQELKAVFQAIPDELIVLDRTGTVMEHKAGLAGQGLLPDLGAARLTDAVSVEAGTPILDAVGRALGARVGVTLELVVPGGDGTVRSFEVRVFPLTSDRAVALVRDFSDRRRVERQIAHMAYHDTLTGLANRAYFQERLEAHIVRAQERRDRMAVLFLDMDRFKAVNDTLGHAAGDEMLVAVAERLRRVLRATDVVSLGGCPEPQVIARMGGDEFTLILPGLGGVDVVRGPAARIIASLAEPLTLQGHEVFPSGSLGVAVYPDHGGDAATLLRNADAAMYHAKAHGRNTFEIYDPSMTERAGDRLQLESALRRAAHLGQLRLVYQPLVDARTGEIASCEALLRWHHPDRGLVSPALFIPLAEESDLILSLGEWVAREACRQVAAWRRAGLIMPRVAFNLSSRQFSRGDLLATVGAAMDDADIRPGELGVELTETAMMQNTGRSASILQRLRDRGVKVSLDDFGTGYSSLAYLRHFPVDVVKVDRSFVKDITERREDVAMIRAIVAMGHGLGLQIVAEGVETMAQLEVLRAEGCDYIQGFLVCGPVGASDLEAFVERHGRRPWAKEGQAIDAAQVA